MQTLHQLETGQLLGIKHLKLSCGLTSFPTQILTLYETLEILDLSDNNLNELPIEFECLSKLKIAFFSDNNFTELPAVLGRCKNLEMIGFKSNKISIIKENAFPEKLRWLILTNNLIEEIPISIGVCYLLQKLALAGNRISKLPTEMADCKNLELIRISANLLTELPRWILNLPKLSWIAFAGNIFSENEYISNNLKEFDWNQISIHEQLGQGASGVISKAYLHGVNEPVAVKIFKGEMTSDGLAISEKKACLAAGSHPNLVNVLGKIINHPEEKKGLVLSLIPSIYLNLGNPPSLESCTRDTFEKHTKFELKQIVKIAKEIAGVTDYLHTLGINHGDLYAHNIMYNENEISILGDFGAASFYKINTIEAKYLERIEVRAFGCLLVDLLNLILEEDKQNQYYKELLELSNNCMQEKVIERPNFKNICTQLTQFNI
jgi:hypothetical protein